MSSRLVLVDEFRVQVRVPRELSVARANAVRQALTRPHFARELHRLVVRSLAGVSAAVTVRLAR